MNGALLEFEQSAIAGTTRARDAGLTLVDLAGGVMLDVDVQAARIIPMTPTAGTTLRMKLSFSQTAQLERLDRSCVAVWPI